MMMKNRARIVMALGGTLVLASLGMGRFAAADGRDPWGRGERREQRRDWLAEGSAWTGSRTTKEAEYAVDARVVSRTDGGLVLRTHEKTNDDLTLEWTFEVKDTTLKLVKVATTSKGDGQREGPWGSGEVRETRDDGKSGAKIDLDYGWRLKEGKGNGKGKAVEGSLRLKRD